MTFAELNLVPTLLQAVQACGYTEPTPIQEQAIPEALAGRDLMASAQTGTGKTAAFMLPALQRLSELKKGPKGAPRVLVLTPTRELAAQVLEATRTYGRNLRLRSAVLLGGTPYREQFRALAQPIDLVVATPGRLIDHLERGSLDLSRLELLVLDEADRMLDMGFRPDVDKVIAAAPTGRQTLLFTATLDRAMAELAARLLKDPVRIDIAGEKRSRRRDRAAPARSGRPAAQAATTPSAGGRRGAEPGHHLRRHQARRRHPGPGSGRPGAPRRGPSRRHDPAGAKPHRAAICAGDASGCWWPRTSPPAAST